MTTPMPNSAPSWQPFVRTDGDWEERWSAFAAALGPSGCDAPEIEDYMAMYRTAEGHVFKHRMTRKSILLRHDGTIADFTW